MLFRNAFIFRLTRRFEPDASTLAELLGQRTFAPCGGLQASSFGWVPVTDLAPGELVREVAGCLLFCARREDKVIPASALAEALAERVQKIEQAESRSLNTRERASLREDTLASLLPRALTRSKRIFGYVAPKDDLLVVSAATAAEADLFTACLRDCLGGLPAVTPQLRAKPIEVFTHWLQSRRLPDHFALGDQCDLVDPEDGSSTSCRRQDLASREIRGHLDAGKVCTRLGLCWHGDLRFTIDKELAVKQLRWESTTESEDPIEDPLASLDAAFAAMTLEFARLLPALFSALGGESRD